MRESFTDTLRAALDGAQRAARDLNQDFVGTEHLMLGLLAGDGAADGEAGRALKAAHAAPAVVRSALLAEVPRGASPPVVHGDLPLSPKAQRAINGAIVKAQSAHDRRVSTRFLLLSLFDELPPAVRAAVDRTGCDLHTLESQLADRPATAEV